MALGGSHGAGSGDWQERVTMDIAKTQQLPESSSSWSPQRPSKPAIERARALINAIRVKEVPIPFTSASPDGGICFEWRKPDRKLTFHVFADGSIEFYAVGVYAQTVEGEITQRLSQADELVANFAR